MTAIATHTAARPRSVSHGFDGWQSARRRQFAWVFDPNDAIDAGDDYIPLVRAVIGIDHTGKLRLAGCELVLCDFDGERLIDVTRDVPEAFYAPRNGVAERWLDARWHGSDDMRIEVERALAARGINLKGMR